MLEHPRRIVTLIALLAGALAPVSTRADRIDDYVRAKLTGRHIPGASVAVIRHGKVLLARGYGLANVEWRERATPDTAYELRSLYRYRARYPHSTLLWTFTLSADSKIADLQPAEEG